MAEPEEMVCQDKYYVCIISARESLSEYNSRRRRKRRGNDEPTARKDEDWI